MIKFRMNIKQPRTKFAIPRSQVKKVMGVQILERRFPSRYSRFNLQKKVGKYSPFDL